jgi:imidazole glycerol-phosphate synthase subunit HisH
MSICILDFGSGNVKSVYNAFSQLGDCVISNSVRDLDRADHIVLPGVGSYKDAMNRIMSNLPIVELRKQLDKGKPFLGICVGMQVLSTTGIEFVEAKGLDLIPGTVARIDVNIRPLPHVGWNNLIEIDDSILTRDVSEEDDFYFTHSYCYTELSDGNVIAKTEYESIFPAIISRNNIYGVQFHPEKSQKSGFKLMKNFLDIK